MDPGSAPTPPTFEERAAGRLDVGFALAFQQQRRVRGPGRRGRGRGLRGHNHAYQRHCAFDPRTARTSAGLKRRRGGARDPVRADAGDPRGGCVAFGRGGVGGDRTGEPDDQGPRPRPARAGVDRRGTGGGGFTRTVGAAFAQVTSRVRARAADGAHATALVGEFVDARDRGGIGANERTVLDGSPSQNRNRNETPAAEVKKRERAVSRAGNTYGSTKRRERG